MQQASATMSAPVTTTEMTFAPGFSEIAPLAGDRKLVTLSNSMRIEADQVLWAVGMTVEDHAPAGGLGEAVAGAVRVPKLSMLAVKSLPRSAKPTELLAMHEIDAAAIVKAVERLIG